MAAKGRDPRRERFWRKEMSAWRASGLGIRAYCRRHGLTETSFHFWRRELLRRDAEPGRRRPPRGASATPTFVPVTVLPTATQPTATLPATVPTVTVEVRCPSGHVVSLPLASLALTDRGVLRLFFAALAPEARDAEVTARREVPPC